MVICEKIYDIRVINNASTCYLFVLFCRIIDMIFSNASQWIAGSETRESREEPLSDDGDKDYNGGGDGDSQDVQHVIASQSASGSQIPKPSSAAKIQEDDRLTSATDLEPRSAPKSQAPTHGTQPDVSSSQLGIVISEEGRSTGSSTKHGKIRPVMFGMNICKS
jgi:hypothetical protein